MRVWGKGGTSRQGEKKGRGMKDRYSRQAGVSRVRLLSIRTLGSDREGLKHLESLRGGGLGPGRILKGKEIF